MKRGPRCLFPVLIFLLLLAPSRARAAAPPVVAGFERFRVAEKADPARGGRLLLGELNCVSCHRAPDAAFGRKQAPVLDAVGARVRLGHLRAFLADPQAVKPGTTMPNVFAGDADAARKVEALAHFLAATGTPKLERPDTRQVAPGRDHYARAGCAACHGPRDAKANALPTTATTVPLPDLRAKYTLATLTAFLEHPLHSRPGGRMPQLLNNKEAREVANYLLQGIAVNWPETKGSTTFAVYHGTWDKLPDFDKLKPAVTGTGPAFDLSASDRRSNYAVKFDGVFKIEQPGMYKLTLNSDDGSRLLIDGYSVVDNDGIHAMKSAVRTVRLAKGRHKVSVGFFQGGGEDELEVLIEGPGLGQQPFGGLVAATEEALDRVAPPARKPDDPDYLEPRPVLAEQGRALFASVGCANCHDLKSNGKAVAATLTAPSLEKLRPAGGCLAAPAGKGLPSYALSEPQRSALTAALTTPPPAPTEPAARVADTMRTFHCYACHARDKVGGPEEAANAVFVTTQPEMGDEGRLPPPLDGVGAKMNADYLKNLLDKGVHDRPYMQTRMPGFGAANVGHLAAAFGQLDTLPTVPEVRFDATDAKVRAAGRHMVGAQAFGCIKCHTFAGHKAEGVQGMDMTVLTKRLRRDWFQAYLATPQRFRPGTRMPAAWPDGQSFYPDLLDGKMITQIEAIWFYLKDGTRAQLPIGLGKQSIPLVATKEAVIYRNFIEGAGSRAIGVGYPEKVNLAFDANEMRLALLWQGAFIDAARHWTDRGSGFEGPLGDNILALHGGAPLTTLKKTDEPWPTSSAREQGWRFLGYRLSPDERPTFHYGRSELRVEDYPEPRAGKEPFLRRTLRLTGTIGGEWYFRAAVGNKLESLGSGNYRVDGWRLKVEGGAAPLVRSVGGKAELLVPVRFDGGKASLVLEYAW